MQGYVRYAVFLVPDADSGLGRFGNSWLGFDPGTGKDMPRPRIKGMEADEISRITAAPSRYGFHGTLTPPFALAAGHDIKRLDLHIEEMAINSRTFEIPSLRVKIIDHFVALVPSRPCYLLNKLAASYVRKLDNFRAPQDKASIQRRRQAGLTNSQEMLLKRWGYPYVLDDFRFHLTLTGSLNNDQDTRLHRILQEAFSALASEPLPVCDIALFGDPGSGGRFRLLKRYPLGG